MKPVHRRVMFAIVIPLGVSLILGLLMMDLTGRNKFLETENPSAPLYSRIIGYDETEVRNHWNWLGADGREVERRFLLVDLAFPIAFGSGFLAGLFLAWGGAGRPFRVGWLVVPVMITVLADWTENLIQLVQLSRFSNDVPLQVAWIRVASFATSTKLLFFIVSIALIIVLCSLILFRGQVGTTKTSDNPDKQ